LAGYANGHQIKATTALSSPANGDYAQHRMNVEGYRVARLGWGAAGAQSLAYALQFYSTASGTIFIRFANSAADRNYYVEHAVSAGWNFLSGTIAGDTSGTWLQTTGIGLRVIIGVAGKAASPVAPNAWTATGALQTTNSTNLLGTNNNLTIATGLVLLPGIELPASPRAPFIMRPFDQELSACQRYWEKTYDYGTAVGAASAGAGLRMGLAMSASAVAIAGNFKARKRISPAITLISFNGTTGVMAAQASNADTAAATPQFIGEDGFCSVTSSGLTAGAGYHVHFVASARL
jgi:hypothetical protein